MSASQTSGGLSRAALPRLFPTRRPRLLYLITRAERGGAQTHVLDLARGMTENFDVEVATGEEGFLTETCREQGIPVHVVRCFEREIRPAKDVRCLRELMQLMRRIEPDLVHAHTFKAGFLGRHAAMRLKIPSVYTVHMWPFGQAVPLTWRLTAPICERLAARWCDRIITVSEVGVKIAASHRVCGPSKVVSVWNGIPNHAMRARLDRDQNLSCTMVARFTHFKDHDVLLRAFATADGDARLVLVGDGDTLPAAKRLAQQLGIDERVEFAGARSDVPELLAETDIFILASKQETLPISILEAMRAGLPVIASDVGGISEEVVHGETGFLVPPGAVAEMGQALKCLLADKKLRMAMGRAGRRRFERLFLADSMIQKTCAIYEEVLAERLAAK